MFKTKIGYDYDQLKCFILNTSSYLHPFCSSRTQAEMGHTCRGTINLATANIAVEDSCNFVISNGGTQTYHLKASSEVERQRWITALELAKAKAFRMQAESGKSRPLLTLGMEQETAFENSTTLHTHTFWGGKRFTVFVPLFLSLQMILGTSPLLLPQDRVEAHVTQRCSPLSGPWAAKWRI